MNTFPKFPKSFWRISAFAPIFLMLAVAPASTGQYLGSLPHSLAGTWRITRILPTTNTTCWSREQAKTLLGTNITYRSDLLRWHGGQIEVNDVSLREITDAEFREENAGPETPATFAQLGIHANKVTEVDMQHEDSDVLPASTAVPGDSVLLAGSNRIVLSSCGIYFEATRAASGSSSHNAGR